MAPRDELPEGTDHIINGAMETGEPTSEGTTASTGSSGGAASGFIGSTGDDTGGTTLREGAMGTIRNGASNLRQQATDRVRTLADDGKTRATDALDELSRVVEETAAQIDERLGAEYGDYARRAASAVSGLATNLRDRDVEELYDGAREIVRKSPVIAVGTAAIVGFALVRLVKAGLDNGSSDGGKADTSA